MLIREAKLLKGTEQQYSSLDEAIRTARFIRNSCTRYWMDNQGVGKSSLSALCKILARQFPWASKLNSTGLPSHAERAWQSIVSFYRRCREGAN